MSGARDHVAEGAASTSALDAELRALGGTAAEKAASFTITHREHPVLVECRTDNDGFELTSPALGTIGAAGWLTNIALVGALVLLAKQIRPSVQGGSTSLFLAAFVLANAAGALGAIGYGRLVGRRVRGRADAHRLVQGARLAAFGGLSVLVFVTAFLGALVVAG